MTDSKAVWHNIHACNRIRGGGEKEEKQQVSPTREDPDLILAGKHTIRLRTEASLSQQGITFCKEFFWGLPFFLYYWTTPRQQQKQQHHLSEFETSEAVMSILRTTDCSSRRRHNIFTSLALFFFYLACLDLLPLLFPFFSSTSFLFLPRASVVVLARSLL